MKVTQINLLGKKISLPLLHTNLRTRLTLSLGGEAIIPPAMAPRLLMEFASLAQSQETEEIEKNQIRTEAENITNEKEEIQSRDHQSEVSLLTNREYQVLELVAQGMTNKGIANQLIISANTVRSHLRCILDKLHMNNRVQAALWFQEQKSTTSK
jgi:DNA-binding NarL/FixJ family response regulator